MRVILATNNKNKVKEIEAILDTKVYSLAEIGCNVEVEETGVTFEENAYLKAHEISLLYPNDVIISDDSGLEVEALNNAPGVYSARYSKEQTDSANNLLLLKNLEGITKRNAKFVCVICYIKSGKVNYFRGELNGVIANEINGNNGFGYDPVFLVDNKSLASYLPVEKNKFSHRFNALKKLENYIKG